MRIYHTCIIEVCMLLLTLWRQRCDDQPVAVMEMGMVAMMMAPSLRCKCWDANAGFFGSAVTVQSNFVVVKEVLV